MRDVVIVDAVGVPIGRRGGAPAATSSADVSVPVLHDLVEQV